MVGAFAALSGADLADCRLADGRALVTATARQDRAALLARLGAVRSPLRPGGERRLVSEQLAVPAPARGRGLGGRLLEAYLDRGAAAGYSRYRLDVEAGNTAAIQALRGARLPRDARRVERFGEAALPRHGDGGLTAAVGKPDQGLKIRLLQVLALHAPGATSLRPSFTDFGASRSAKASRSDRTRCSRRRSRDES